MPHGSRRPGTPTRRRAKDRCSVVPYHLCFHLSGPKSGTRPVLVEAIDLRELRILRALYGEPEGRRLEQYKIKYDRGPLDATVKKGWVRLVAGNYYLTAKGAEFCRGYLGQLADWQPVN